MLCRNLPYGFIQELVRTTHQDEEVFKQVRFCEFATEPLRGRFLKPPSITNFGEFPGGSVGYGSSVVTAVAQVRSLLQELPYAVGTAAPPPKKKEKEN